MFTWGAAYPRLTSIWNPIKPELQDFVSTIGSYDKVGIIDYGNIKSGYQEWGSTLENAS